MLGLVEGFGLGSVDLDDGDGRDGAGDGCGDGGRRPHVQTQVVLLLLQ